MKKFLSLIFGLMFVGCTVTSVFATPNAPSSTTPNSTQSPASTTGALDATCNDILTRAQTPPPNPPIDGDIVVLLTEQIKSGGGNIPCSKVIECVRKRVRTDGANANKSAAEREQTEITLLRTNYSQCIIAGKDGLGLLNNYARLVYQWIAGIVGAICVLVIILSGIQISMGGLSQDEVGTAKERITRSLMGLAVLFLSAFILYSINPIFFS